MGIGSREKIKCEDYCEADCENSFLVSDPHKGESLGACDELPWGVVLT